MNSTNATMEQRYTPPMILLKLRGLVTFPRGQYSTNFGDLAAQDIALQADYKDGIVALPCFLGGFFVIWGLVLVYLMIKGKSVGCASGRAFEITAPEKQSNSSNHKQQQLSSQSSIASQDDGTESKNYQGEAGLETESFSSSLCSFDAASRFEATASVDERTADTIPRVESPRAARTRMAFLVFACILLACVPLTLAFAFAPMKDTVKSFDGNIDAIEEVLVQVRAVLKTISTASQSTMSILSQTSINSTTFCPNINNTQFRTRGANLQGLADLVTIQYVELNDNITEKMAEIHDFLDTVENVTVVVQGYVDQAENFIWLVPALLLAVSIVTALATFGVILAWKQDSGIGLQRCMSYGVLPILTALCVMCVILACAASASTAVSTDFCIPGSTLSSPDETVRAMLLASGALPNSTKYQYLAAYATGCSGQEPTKVLDELELASQDAVDEIWTRISAVDAFGRSAMSAACGGTGLDELLSAARSIAKLLTKVRRALDSATDSLACDRISPLYEQGVHVAICTDLAEASSWGAIAFCVIGVAMLALISLRASWRLNIDEYRIYHDESEVAENMVVDEHEEYLRYISRYKHEWQEYHGFESTSIKISTSFSSSEGDQGDLASIFSASASVSRATGCTETGEFRSRNDEISIQSADISFPSLNVMPTDDSGEQRQIVPIPPPILTTGSTRKCKALPLDGGHSDESPQLLKSAAEIEKQKSELDSVPVDAADAASENTEDSTDFSSIGRNAFVSPHLYWKRYDLGIEATVSSVSDSLVVSPNSDGDKFDLTKTSSQSKLRRTHLDVSDEKLPSSLSGHDRSLSTNNMKAHGTSSVVGRMRTDPLPSSITRTTSADPTKQLFNI